MPQAKPVARTLQPPKVGKDSQKHNDRPVSCNTAAALCTFAHTGGPPLLRLITLLFIALTSFYSHESNFLAYGSDLADGSWTRSYCSRR
jgi:hypothetical protein